MDRTMCVALNMQQVSQCVRQHYKAWLANALLTACRMCVLMQDAHRQRTVNWVDATGGTNAAFDFTTKGILQEALGRNELWRLVDAQVRARVWFDQRFITL
jgi:hypothetical protein